MGPASMCCKRLLLRDDEGNHWAPRAALIADLCRTVHRRPLPTGLGGTVSALDADDAPGTAGGVTDAILDVHVVYFCIHNWTSLQTFAAVLVYVRRKSYMAKAPCKKSFPPVGGGVFWHGFFYALDLIKRWVWLQKGGKRWMNCCM